jgi:hypothetical protein
MCQEECVHRLYLSVAQARRKWNGTVHVRVKVATGFAEVSPWDVRLIATEEETRAPWMVIARQRLASA